MLGIQLSDVVCGDMRWVLVSNYMVVRLNLQNPNALNLQPESTETLSSSFHG